MGNLIKRLRKGEDCSMNTETTTPEGDAISRALQRAYLAGFNTAGEGYNGEYPFSDSGRCPSSDEDWITGRDMVIEKLIAALPSPQNGESELRTDGPERIWAWEGDGQDGWENAYATVSHVSKGQVEYIRADLAHEAVNGAATPAPIEAGLREALELIRWAHDKLYEINPSNYDHDEVCRLNDASVEVILALAPLLGETHGKSAEWWAEHKTGPLRAQSAPVGGEVKG